ncbi:MULTISPECIES: hypothetical protein [Rhizobium]|uniref:hypothetical protein n=1 Tax=Rhizobium TaxID=379 RepID=UPI000A20445A|nr:MULTISPECIES: hypothetical protein [Rhizobium]ARO29052.1 hypothetical protein NXC14_CH01057 [Rhizobium sp. NXC14]MBB3356161.1 hypothetical protein [Rhizobium sp. BK049]MBX5137171.1 hypothetical protein [Rhizobium lentis]MBX5143318.1 hypothetical protein [Rhizobium lentis]MDK4736244.1 hypothetical protein [Rhizobium sp. CNPSo 3490]
MISPEIAARPQASALGAIDHTEPSLPMELVELELSLEGYAGGDAGFCEAVRQAAGRSGGELLFDLPAAGLIEDCRRIAVLRIPDGENMRVVLALLDHNGTEIRMQAPDEETAHLVRFADAFIEVLERI